MLNRRAYTEFAIGRNLSEFRAAHEPRYEAHYLAGKNSNRLLKKSLAVRF